MKTILKIVPFLFVAFLAGCTTTIAIDSYNNSGCCKPIITAPITGTAKVKPAVKPATVAPKKVAPEKTPKILSDDPLIRHGHNNLPSIAAINKIDKPPCPNPNPKPNPNSPPCPNPSPKPLKHPCNPNPPCNKDSGYDKGGKCDSGKNGKDKGDSGKNHDGHDKENCRR